MEQAYGLQAYIGCLLVTMLAASGCGWEPQFSSATSTTKAEFPRTDVVTIDGGIVFADQPSYRCITLAQLGFENIQTAADISSIRSSCKCVQAQVIQYRCGPMQICDALRLDFVPESPPADNPEEVYLSVVVTIEPKRGAARTLVVKVLEVQPVM